MTDSSQPLSDALRDALFGSDGDVYAVLDGASVPDLLETLYKEEPVFQCLYRGELEPDLAEVAPYLVHLEPGSAFASWLLREGWGKHWGIFLRSTANLTVLRGHLRRFLMVHDSSGKPLYFRYYDPRVLREFLPLCEPGELKELFGPISAYLMEEADPAVLLRFECHDAVLECHRESLDRRSLGAPVR